MAQIFARLVSMRATIGFAASGALSLLGNSVAGVVLPLVLLATTGDVLAAGTLAVVCAIPQVICGVLGGAVLDRLNRRTVSIVSDLVSALCVAALPIVHMTVGLSFEWFVLFGVLGAVGDIPGMTARDTLLPAVTAYDKVSLERYMGVSGSLESLVTIVGPAIAAACMAWGGDINALWVTAALSLCAALLTCTIPRQVGVPGQNGAAVTLSPDTRRGGLLRTGMTSLREGLSILCTGDPIIRATLLLNLGVVGVMAGFQGIVLPVFFTERGDTALLGMVLSFLSGGMLLGSLVYSAAASKLRRRGWYVLSFTGMFVGIAILGSLASVPFMLLGSFLCGFAAGPVSALLGFLMLDRIPDARRGAALGTQNTLMLVIGPASVFATSTLVELFGVTATSYGLVGAWGLVTLGALVARTMRTLDDAVLAPKPPYDPNSLM